MKGFLLSVLHARVLGKDEEDEDENEKEEEEEEKKNDERRE